MRVACSQPKAGRDGETFDESKIVKTPKAYEEGVRLLGRIAHEFAGRESITAAAGGIAGPFNREKNMLVNAPNLPQWVGKPVRDDIAREIGLPAQAGAPVFLENDTALGGLGEAVAGAGKGYGIVAYITVSTGVNGVRIVDGEIDKNAMGFEIGHQIIHMGINIPFISPHVQRLDAYISGAAIKNRYLRAPRKIRSKKAWERAARILAYGVHNTLMYWSPDIVVIGGSMMLAPYGTEGSRVENQPNGISIERVRVHLKQTVKIFPEIPPVEKATLGDKAGLYGALALIGQR